jgi:hypothetical protein
MPIRWPARLGLVSVSVLALAACNRSGSNTQGPAAGSDGPLATAASDTVLPADGGAGLGGGVQSAQPMSPGEATASVGAAPSASAVAAAPEIAVAQAMDQGVASGAAAQAYSFNDAGQEVRVWDDPRRGSRIVTAGGAISYYRPGAPDPYLIRQGDSFYVLSGGRIARAFDVHGRVITIQPAMRTRFETVVTRTRTIRREAEQRRPPAAQRRDDNRVEAAQDDARQAARDARETGRNAADARSSAQDAQRDANRADHKADTPAQQRAAQEAQRQANKADHAADRAADKAKDTRAEAKDAKQLAAQCARQRQRGEKVDANCKG